MQGQVLNVSKVKEIITISGDSFFAELIMEDDSFYYFATPMKLQIAMNPMTGQATPIFVPLSQSKLDIEVKLKKDFVMAVIDVTPEIEQTYYQSRLALRQKEAELLNQLKNKTPRQGN